MARLGPEPHLVIVGDHSHDSFLTCFRELSQECARLGLTERVTFTGFVPDDDLVALYNAARVLALPSVAEGFGLPAIEAMACGLPVAASRRGSLPEIVGDAGVFFDPLDNEDMATALRRLLEDDTLRASLSVAGLARASRRSWNEAAGKTVRLIEQTVRGA
jgi:glycosyltransferase involved in cell wall biosynthesis